MPAPSRIEAFAIISADGKIADAAGHMPEALKIDADQEFFHAGLDRAAVVVHGRRSHEGGPNAARRRRLVVTSRVASLAPAPAYPNALLWNPRGASLAEAWSAFGARLQAPLPSSVAPMSTRCSGRRAMMPSISPASRRRGFPAVAPSFEICRPVARLKTSWQAMDCIPACRKRLIRPPE